MTIWSPGQDNWLSILCPDTIIKSEFSHDLALLDSERNSVGPSHVFIYIISLFLDKGLPEGKVHDINLCRALCF